MCHTGAMRQRHFIDSHKGLTGPAVLAMMAYHHQWDNPTAWVYLALHGTYGLLWILKSRLFGDRQWDQPTTLRYGLTIWAGLSLYWYGPWVLTSRGVRDPGWYLGLCIACYALGVFFHFASDMQKHTALRLRPGLLTDGLWGCSRNPNYFGELLIYLGFCLLPRHPGPLLALGLFVVAVWIPNMLRKDRSLSRYPGFAEYRARTPMLLPRLF